MDTGYIDDCPKEVIEYVRTVNMTSGKSSTLFSWIGNHSSIECQVNSVSVVADRLNATSHPQVIGDFCSTIATFAQLLNNEAKQKIKEAYLRFPYYSDIALSYFYGLRYNQIDIRSHLKGKFIEDWSFEGPRDQNSDTWHYFMYLASLDEPGAYKALEKKIAETQNGNEATNLIKSLADLKSEDTRRILNLYSQDTRRADGPVGPAQMISETVHFLLMTFP